MSRTSRFVVIVLLLLASFTAVARAQEQAPLEPIPPLTDEERKAAFPDLKGHTAHDHKLNYFVLFDRFEWQPDRRATWDANGWVGGDIHRLWFRTEGETDDGDVAQAEAHLLYGRSISRWWDLVGGVRQDVRPGPARTWAAFGIQGLAPYWFEVEATAYVGESGRLFARFEAEYELLITNRLILQPLAEFELFSRADSPRGIGAGLSTLEAGARLRYELRREFAPYVGVVWNSKFGDTADFARMAGNDVRATRLVAGIRVWF